MNGRCDNYCIFFQFLGIITSVTFGEISHSENRIIFNERKASK